MWICRVGQTVTGLLIHANFFLSLLFKMANTRVS